MALSRRTFVRSALISAVGAPAFARLAATPAYASVAPAAGGLYPSNAAPLAPTAFLRLPPGSVQAAGWLAGQLQLQLAGLCGQYPATSHFLNYATTGWVTPSNVGWEEVPYWLRGYGDLAYATGDSTALAATEKWIGGILATAQSDGFFGPTSLRTSLNNGPDFWPYLPLLEAFRTFQEYTGDTRIIPAMDAFFTYMHAQSGSVFSQSWVSYRVADLLESIFWLYNRTGASYLLSLADTVHTNSQNWVNNIPTPHNVNIAQGYREPALYALRNGQSSLTQAAYQNYNTVMGTFGQFAGGGFAGDENYRNGYTDPRQGFETCGIVEFMASHEIMTRLTGDPVWADRCEDLAFNSLPAALDPSGKSTHYITSANSVDMADTAKTFGQFGNNWAMQAYMAGVDQYRCCPHNYGQGWPYFSEEMWLATPDKGLCAAMYAPSKVTAKVGDGTTVNFTETTDYPFNDTVTITLSSPKQLAFPLYVRIPGWCSSPTLQVNGQSVAAAAGPAFARVNRTWSNGDVVTLHLPQVTSLRTWGANHNSVTVDHGPLTYSLQIQENFVQTAGTSQFPQYEVHAASAWNYGLALSSSNPASSLTFVPATAATPANPFTQATVPTKITATVQPLNGWQTDSQNVLSTLQASPALPTGPAVAATLIPMGAARLRITSFPTVSSSGALWTAPNTGAWMRIRNANSGKVLAVAGASTADSANVTQYDDNGTADHLWQLIPNGQIRINNKNSSLVLGVTNMSTADSADVVQFDDSGTADHLWTFESDPSGWWKIANVNSGKVLGVSGMSTSNSADVVQFTDNGSADHLWRLRPGGGSWFRIQNKNSSLVLAVSNMSLTDSTQVVQYADSGTPDHLWQLL
ncbi:RICIN domain-containing protein [Actinocrinis sp.]|uniref:RICIN domain-containing protein n=1 Tax=Actinocrinis sp. TaxID=1920516 RepID=UPI0032C239B5